jgi:HSP20 family protein
MAVTRWDPRSTLSTFQREISNLIDSFFGPTSEEGASLSTLIPPVDIEEKDKEFRISVELPGVKKDDVKINLKDNVISISGEKKQEKKVDKENYHRIERTFGKFQRSFTLPDYVDIENIDAGYKDGILNITVPKLKESVSKQIEVKVK